MIGDGAVSGGLGPEVGGVVAEEGGRGLRVPVPFAEDGGLLAAGKEAHRVGRRDRRTRGSRVVERLEPGAGRQDLKDPETPLLGVRVTVLDETVGVGRRGQVVGQVGPEIRSKGEQGLDARTGVRRGEEGMLVVRVVPGKRGIGLVIELFRGVEEGVERRLPEDLGALLAGDDDLLGNRRPVAVVPDRLDCPEDVLEVLLVPDDDHVFRCVLGPVGTDAVDGDDRPGPGVPIVNPGIEKRRLVDDEAVAADLVVLGVGDFRADRPGLSVDIVRGGVIDETPDDLGRHVGRVGDGVEDEGVPGERCAKDLVLIDARPARAVRGVDYRQIAVTARRRLDFDR